MQLNRVFDCLDYMVVGDNSYAVCHINYTLYLQWPSNAYIGYQSTLVGVGVGADQFHSQIHMYNFGYCQQCFDFHKSLHHVFFSWSSNVTLLFLSLSCVTH